jgi:4-amino-4-deoxy-L-arabinose transferase-like glycosyltransferase
VQVHHITTFGNRTGFHRLFTGEMSNEIGWLLLAVLFVLAFGIYSAIRRSLSRDESAALTLWGGWFVVTGLVLSYMGGTVHPYYTVALGPPVAALIGLGGAWAWRRRTRWDGRCALAALVLLAAAPSASLLHHNHLGRQWPRLLLGLGIVAAVGVLIPRRHVTAVGTTIGLVAGLGGAAVVSVITAATPHYGTIPTVMGRGTTGEWMADESTNAELARILADTRTPWSAATNGSQSAAALEIASGTAVMAVGGWSTDPVPDLAQFIDDVHAGRVSYYVEAGRGMTHGEVIRGPNHSTSHTREIADWVAAHYRGTMVGGSTVYRLI